MDTTRKMRTRARKATELGLAVPQVMGHRLVRLAIAGPLPSARDQREFQLMGAEKVVAFSEAWLAVAAAMWQANLTLGSSVWWMMATPTKMGSDSINKWSLTPFSFLRPAWQWHASMMGALDDGFAPIHRTARANARRLARVDPRRRA